MQRQGGDQTDSRDTKVTKARQHQLLDTKRRNESRAGQHYESTIDCSFRHHRARDRCRQEHGEKNPVEGVSTHSHHPVDPRRQQHYGQEQHACVPGRVQKAAAAGKEQRRGIVVWYALNRVTTLFQSAIARAPSSGLSVVASHMQYICIAPM